MTLEACRNRLKQILDDDIFVKEVDTGQRSSMFIENVECMTFDL